MCDDFGNPKTYSDKCNKCKDYKDCLKDQEAQGQEEFEIECMVENAYENQRY